jgi:purine-binding chemotaxis protein CheW
MTQEQFVVVRLGAQEYGIPIAAVDEIARLPENLTKLPKAPAFIDGVINLRGSVVPIVDLRRRFDLPSSTVSTNRRVLILSVSGSRTGFIVDDVSEVIKIDASTIQTAPDLSPEQMRLIGRVANLNDVDRMILLVDPAQLLNRVETEVLEKFARRQPEKTLSPS